MISYYSRQCRLDVRDNYFGTFKVDFKKLLFRYVEVEGRKGPVPVAPNCRDIHAYVLVRYALASYQGGRALV